MSYPNNHKHKFFQKDHEKMMCSECEFELDGEYYVRYVVPLEQENKELRTRLSTILKASEGMEKALEWVLDADLLVGGLKKTVEFTLADFRAVKEGK